MKSKGELAANTTGMQCTDYLKVTEDGEMQHRSLPVISRKKDENGSACSHLLWALWCFLNLGVTRLFKILRGNFSLTITAVWATTAAVEIKFKQLLLVQK